jgi:hypothetical protein
MSEWQMTWPLKGLSYPELEQRKPDEDTLALTADNIRHFPKLTLASNPFYWPTKYQYNLKGKSKSTSGAIVAILSSVVAFFSRNRYPTDDCNVFSTLATNPVFIHYKFKTLLKYALSTKEMYQHICSLHMREGLESEVLRKELGEEYRYVSIALLNEQEKRIKLVKELLINMVEFHRFISEHGEVIIKEILAEFEVAHRKFGNNVIDLTNIRQSFDSLVSETNAIQDEKVRTVEGLVDTFHLTNDVSTLRA